MGMHRLTGERYVPGRVFDVDSNSVIFPVPPGKVRLVHVGLLRKTQASSSVNPALIYRNADGDIWAAFELGDDWSNSDSTDLIQFTPGIATTNLTNRHDSAITVQMSPLPIYSGTVEIVFQGANAPTSDVWSAIAIFQQIG